MEVSASIVKSFVKFDFRQSQPASDVCNDGVMLYACDLLTTGLFWLIFVDSIREGDGERVMLCWKFMLLIFFSSKRKNYTKEAVILLLQQQTMSPRQAAQLQWSRFINTRGRQGTNKPADLHLEHLFRRLKIVMRNLKGNIKVPTYYCKSWLSYRCHPAHLRGIRKRVGTAQNIRFPSCPIFCQRF